MAKRYPIPALSRYEPTIQREARYWRPRLRAWYSIEDLIQEGWYVGLRVMRVFDPEREIKVETLLTRSLRNHYHSLLRMQMTRATNQETYLQSKSRSIDPRGSVDARILFSRLRTLPQAQQDLVYDILDYGDVREVAAHRKWTVYEMKRELSRLRVALTARRPRNNGSR